MEAKTNYTLVGIAVLALTVGLLGAIIWLSVGFQQKKSNTYAVYIHEAVSGLSNDSAVKFNGVQVGTVKSIELNQDDPRQVEILLAIEEGTPITTSTSATLISQGITGTSYVGLTASTSNLTPLKKIPGEKYPIIPAKPSLFNQLDKVLKEVSENVNKVSVEIRHIFDNENARYVKHTLANIEQFTDVIAKNSKNLNNTLASTDTITRNLAQVSQDLPEMVHDLKLTLKQFDKMASSFAKAGDSVSVTMGAGKTAIDKFSQQTIPPAVNLLRKLDAIANNLEKVSDQMRVNPSVLVRGSTPPKPGPGE